MANTAPIKVNNTGAELSEGGYAYLNSTWLRYDDAEQGSSAVTYTITGETNGTLFGPGGVELDPGATFTQYQLGHMQIYFQHDGGETTTATPGRRSRATRMSIRPRPSADLAPTQGKAVSCTRSRNRCASGCALS